MRIDIKKIKLYIVNIKDKSNKIKICINKYKQWLMDNLKSERASKIYSVLLNVYAYGFILLIPLWKFLGINYNFWNITSVGIVWYIFKAEAPRIISSCFPPREQIKIIG